VAVNFYGWKKPEYSEKTTDLSQVKMFQWRSLGLFSSEAICRAQRGAKMLGGPEIKKKWAIETHFSEFKWIIYDFNNNIVHENPIWKTHLSKI
jgi:hypothetical protein